MNKATKENGPSGPEALGICIVAVMFVLGILALVGCDQGRALAFTVGYNSEEANETLVLKRCGWTGKDDLMRCTYGESK